MWALRGEGAEREVVEGVLEWVSLMVRFRLCWRSVLDLSFVAVEALIEFELQSQMSETLVP